MSKDWPMQCPVDPELLESLACVMKSVATAAHRHGPETYGLFSNAVLGERIMQISDDLGAFEGLTDNLDGDSIGKLGDLISELSLLGAEIKLFRKSA